MPSGLRFTVKLDKVLYNLSPAQWDLLQKKSFKVSGDWKQERSLRGPVKQKLFTVNGTKAVRTDLGNELVKAMKLKLKKKEQR